LPSTEPGSSIELRSSRCSSVPTLRCSPLSGWLALQLSSGFETGEWLLPAGVALISSALAVEFLKNLIGRGRRASSFAVVHAAGPSMPSADAAVTGRCDCALSGHELAQLHVPPQCRRDSRHRRLLGRPLRRLPGCALAGVPGPIDVLVGWLLGGGIGLTAAWLVGRTRVPRHR